MIPRYDISFGEQKRGFGGKNCVITVQCMHGFLCRPGYWYTKSVVRLVYQGIVDVLLSVKYEMLHCLADAPQDVG